MATARAGASTGRIARYGRNCKRTAGRRTAGRPVAAACGKIAAWL